MKHASILLVAFGLTVPDLTAGPPVWDKVKAAEYLDKRAKWWMEHATPQRATDATGTVACLSCHTTATYALARPRLKAAAPVDAATPLTALLKNVDRRLVAWPTAEEMYDFKKDESRGTEAVLSTLMLAWNDVANGAGAPTAATKRAFDRLWETQRPDGGWNWLTFTLEPWETGDAEYFGTALAALAIGTAPGYYTAKPPAELEDKVAKVRTYLKTKRKPEHYYHETWLLLASTKLSGLLTATEQKEIIDRLKGMQKTAGADAGGWVLLEFAKWRYNQPTPPAMPPATPPPLDPRTKQPDGYATGLVTYTLLRAGVKADDPAVAAGLLWLTKNQQADGSWPAVSINKKRLAGNFAEFFMSDAATAWATIALLEANQ